MKMKMKNSNNKTIKPLGSDDFLRLGRYIKYDYENKKISFEEMVVIIWLQLGTNPYRGKCAISYEGLAQELYGLVKNIGKNHRKNFINKIMLKLRQKKYISYTSQQGRRGSFEVLINNYPLSDGTFTNTEYKFEKNNSRSSDIDVSRTSAEVEGEVLPKKQRFEPDINEEAERYLGTTQDSKSRSSNNNNENNNIKPSYPVNGNDNDGNDIQETIDYIPNSDEEEECKNMAIELREKDIRFILSSRKKYGLKIVKKAYESTMKGLETGRVQNRGAYFNAIVKKIGESQLTEQDDDF